MTDIAFRGRGKDNSHRKFPGERGPRADRAEAKRQEAAARAESWGSLGPGGQLRALDDRLGRGVGAKRQRARLEKSRLDRCA